jgi:hypothetical protein
MRFGTPLLACESFRQETMGDEMMESLSQLPTMENPEVDAQTILSGNTFQ